MSIDSSSIIAIRNTLPYNLNRRQTPICHRNSHYTAQSNIMTWTRLIRFVSADGTTNFGDALLDDAADIHQKISLNELFAQQLKGSSPFDLQPTGKKLQVKSLLPLLTPQDVPIIRCIGLNYTKHSKLTYDDLITLPT